MSGYEKLKEGFDVFCLGQNIHNLRIVLKREVGIVQGIRSRISRHNANSFNESWVDESSCSKVELDDVQVGGDENDITEVLKMECNVHKPASQDFPDSEHEKMKTEAERAFMSFCWQYGIPYFPTSLCKNKGIYSQNNNGEQQQSSGNPGGSSKGEGTGQSQRQNEASNVHPTQSQSTVPVAGAGGGGKRPSNDTSSSSSDTDFTISTINIHENAPPTTTTVSPTHSMISIASPSRRKKFRKRRQISRTSGDGVIPTVQNIQILPSLSVAPSITSIASTMQSISVQSPKQRKFVRITAAEADKEHLNIRTFSVTGKKQKTTNLNQNAISAKKLSQKDFVLPPPAKKPRKMVDDQKPFSRQITPSTKTIPFAVRMGPTTVVSEAAQSVASSVLQKPRVSRISGELENPPHHHHHHHHHYHRTSFYQNRFISTNNLRKEKNNEWLCWSSSDESADEDAEEKDKTRDPKVKDGPVDPDLQVFAGSIKHLLQLNDALGLNPYRRKIRSNKCIQVKWRPRSWEFFSVCCKAILFFIYTMNIFSTLLFVIRLEEPYTASDAIVQDDFANNLAATLYFFFLTLFLSIWSISCIMELGPSYAEFMTRFNLAICLLKYDVTEGLNKMVSRHLLAVAFFMVAIIILFFAGRMETSLIRESCGFLGYCILRPFDYKLRESSYFPLVEMFGLLVFLHGVLCFNVVLLYFAVYGKALGNMAKNLNLRVAYALGKIVEFLPDGTNKVVKKQIPFQKLHAEHLVIASLFRNISHVNAIVFTTYFLTMGLEMMLTIWMIFGMFLNESPDPIEWYFERVGTTQVAVPLRAKEFKGEIFVATLVQFYITMLTYWMFGGLFHHAGEFMQYCSEYVRRHGLMLCKSAIQRRFVISMMVSYSPKNPYWIGRQFTMNRSFLVGFLGFIIATSMVTVSFNPQRIGISTREKCSSLGRCSGFRIPRSHLDIYYRSSHHVPPRTISTHTVKMNPDLTILNDPEQNLQKYERDISLFTSCGSFGTLPHSTKKANNLTCHASWKGKGHPSKVEYPTFYTKMKYSDSVPKDLKVFKPLKEPFKAKKGGQISFCRSKLFTRHNFPRGTSKLVDCFGNEVSSNEVDDCGNLNASTPAKDGTEMSAVLRPVHIHQLAKGIPDDIMCCFHYPGIDFNGHQLKVCNMPDPVTYKAACKTGTSRSRMSTKLVFEHHQRLLSRLNYERSTSGNDGFLMKNENTIRNCLCPPLDDVYLKSCHCPAFYLPPCTPGHFTGVNKDYAVPCGPVYIPLLFQVNWEHSVSFPSKSMRLGTECPKDAFPVHTVYHGNKNLTNDYDGFMKFCTPNIKGITVILSDCSGTPISRIEKDDCFNWNIKTPDSTGEMSQAAALSLRALDYDTASKQIVERDMDTKLFVCCYQYASQVFQTDAQMKFCNAPNQKIANDKSWCGDVAENGIRNPSPFDKRIHEQLKKKLELTIQFKKKKGNPKWLYDTVANRGWTRCMCSNKVDGIALGDFDAIKKECIDDIPPPLELHAESIINVYPPCNHNWPNKASIPKLQVAMVFTKENDIWEMVDRFHKGLSETSQCLKDYTFYERLPSALIYDAFLEQVDIKIKDDCGNLNIAVRPEGFTYRKLPRLTLTLEYRMNLYDPSHFQTSENVYCCFHYSSFGEQWRVCNMPDAQSVINKCKKTNDLKRKRHEMELVRKMLVHDKGAYYLGNETTSSYPDELSWNSDNEEAWRKCICGRSPKVSHAADKMCEDQYLPPCIVPRTKEIFTPSIHDTYTKCRTDWPFGWPSTLSLPIVMKHSSEFFTKEPLFRNGPQSEDCPKINYRPVTLSPTSLTDCYGKSLTSVKHDECGNPRLHTPTLNNLTKRDSPKLRLIALNQIPGFPLNDEKIFCCYEYAIGKANEVKVCNKPNKDVIESHCSDARRSPDTVSFVQKLKEYRVSTRDVLANNVAFNDAGRLRWTNCICNEKADACKIIRQNILQSFCHKDTTWVDKMFYECNVTEPVHGHPLWEDVNKEKPFIYPKIFRQVKPGTYKPLLTIQRGDCKLFNISKPLLSGIKFEQLPLKDPVIDCNNNKYPENSSLDYTDDLGNLVLVGAVETKSRRYLYASEFRLVPLDTTDRFLCCVEYNRGLEGFNDAAVQQAGTCSMPNYDVMKRELDKRKHVLEDSSTYKEMYHKSLRNKIKGMSKPEKEQELRKTENVKCLCNHLEAVRKHEVYGSPNTGDCDNLFDDKKGGSAGRSAGGRTTPNNDPLTNILNHGASIVNHGINTINSFTGGFLGRKKRK